jgi:hypothetical protein
MRKKKWNSSIAIALEPEQHERQRTPLENRVAISVDEFCGLLGFSRNKFYSEVKARRINILKAGKKTLLSASEPARYLQRLASLRHQP